MAIRIEKEDIEAGPYEPFHYQQQSTSLKRKLVSRVAFGVTLLITAYLSLASLARQEQVRVFLALFAPAPIAPTQLFEVLPAFTAPPLPVTELVFDAAAVTDGLTASYSAPAEFNFTGGYLTLNFSTPALVDAGAAVIEISVAGSPIWRSATPLAKVDSDVFSSTVKNVTEYLSLFQSDAEILVTVIEGSSAATVTLELALYSEPAAPVAPVFGLPIASVFAPSGPASHVFALQKKPVTFPAESFTATLPQLASNVTAAKVSLFVSATEEEIDYYKSGISAVGAPASKGPFRQLNLFVAGVFVGSVSPKPTLFHADKLLDTPTNPWTPVVDSGSYSGFTYDVDLVGLLPLLWEAEQTLEIVVVSPITAADATPIPAPAHPVTAVTNIASGSWVVSGNLLAWESPFVSSATGAVVTSESLQEESAKVVAPPKVSPWQPSLSNLKATSTLNSTIASTFNFVLLDNSTSSINIVANTSSFLFLTRQEMLISTPVGPPGSGAEKSKNTITSFALGYNKFDLEVQNAITNVTLYSSSSKIATPLNFRVESSTNATGAVTTSYKGDIDFSIKKKVNKVPVSSIELEEKITLDPVLGTQIDASYKSKLTPKYLRKVQVVNGVVVSDVETPALI